MALADEILKLRTQADTTTVAVRSAFDRKTDEAFQADNALRLGGATREEMVATTTGAIAAHTNNTSNPHGVTTETIGTYGTAVIDQKIAALVPRNLLPVSQFGSPTEALALDVTLTPASRLVEFGSNPAFIAGASYTVPGAQFTVPENQVRYVYLKLVQGSPMLSLETAQLPESSTVMQVGAIQFTGGAVAVNTIGKVTRLDIFRISRVPAGSAIPVSSGFPGDPAALLWK